LLSEASLKVRRAELNDLDKLVEFTAAEAREAEGHEKDTKTLGDGIKAALEDRSIAMYWVLLNQNNEPVGSASALKEWSDWSAGYYWWIQSMYIESDYRGKGYMDLLLDAIRSDMKKQDGLELRLYVNEDNQVAIKAYKKSNFTFSKYRIMIQK
jgi:ribosomal protein S18 acetylase RimI-like enzyme